MRRRLPGTKDQPRQPHPWSSSAEFRAIAKAALRRFNAERHLHPICGAMAKSTGEPCRQMPAKGRTRCKLHGGATPRGDGPAGWHTPGFPAGLPTGKPRSDAYKARKRREKRARLAAMTPEERARHEDWHSTHKAGNAAQRTHTRRNRDTRRWLETIMREPPTAPTPDRAELEMLRAKLQAHIARLDAEVIEPTENEPRIGGLFD